MEQPTVASEILHGYLVAMELSPEAFGAACQPPISGVSVRTVLAGHPVGAKVAKAIAGQVPALTLDSLILPEPSSRGKRAAAGSAA
jgi:hypothetical protein